MPTPLVSGDILEVRVWCQESEQASVNTFHYAILTVGSPALTDTDFNDQFDALIVTLYPALIQNNGFYRGTSVQILNRNPRPATDQNPLSIAGTGGGTGLPRQACGLTTWRTDFAGPRYRGRTYWPFPSTTEDATIGVPSAAYLTAMGNISDALLNFATTTVSGRTATFGLAILHRGTPLQVAFVTSRQVQQKFATQKKRGSYGKANNVPF